MRNTIISFFLLISLSLSGQTEDVAYPHVPVMTPEAAALTQYADIPVSYYTGIPDISIPLYTIDVDGFQLPITLSYHSSGIRVDQEATWVGLGWVLNAGGRISRTAKCVDDFLIEGFDRAHPYILHGYYDAPDFTFPNDNMYSMIGSLGTTGILTGTYCLRDDSEPDIFCYNLPGYSGKFILDKSRGAVLFDKVHNLRIEVIKESNPTDVYFCITTPEGVQYYFDEKEYSEYYVSNTHLYKNIADYYSQYDDNPTNFTEWSPIRYPDGDTDMIPGPCVPYHMASCWCLTKIVTRTGKEINLYYDQEVQYLPTQESCEVYNNLMNSSYSQFFYKSKVVNEALRLTSISWNNGSISFAASGREDIKEYQSNPSLSSKKLSAMTIRNCNNEIVKEYQFGYSYFNENYNCQSQYAHVFKRLKLDTLTETNSGETHSFSYYPGTFPAKNSKDTDYWNMQNGKTYGSNYQIGIYHGYGEVCRKYKGVNKMSNLDKAVVGMLQEIRYPTGGYARFTYELNCFEPYFYYNTNNDLDPNNSSNTNANSSSLIRKHISVCNDYVEGNHPWLSQTDSWTFEVANSAFISISGHLENSWCGFRDPDYYYRNASANPIAAFKQISPDTHTYITYDCPYVFEGDSGPLPNQEGCEVDVISHGYEVGAGTYEFRTYALPKDVCADWDITVDDHSRPTDVQQPASPEHGGGLRIAMIKTNTSTWIFSYPLGKLMVEPTLYYYGNRIGSGYTYGQCIVQVSESKTPMSTFEIGNAVGYLWVEEKIVSDNQEICTKHFYHNVPETEKFDDNAKFPYSPVMIEYMNGLPRKTEYYENDILKKKIDYEYETTQSNVINAFIDFSGHRLTDELLQYYYQIEWPRKILERESYFFFGHDIVDSCCYTYNTFDYPTTVSHMINGNSHSVHYRYPFDFTDNISQSMVRHHFISTPVEIYKTAGNKVFEGSRTIYNDSTLWFLPQQIHTLKSGAGYSMSNYTNYFRNEVQFDRYDEKGNILQVTKNGVCTSYIWAYGRKYPVAEVRGATYEQVETALGGSDAVSTFSNSQNPSASWIRQFLQPLVSGPMSANMLTTVYTYTPLVGVTSITRPNGTCTYYDYDTAGRLIQIRDGNGNVTNTYNYHYRQN